jgi:hypothetical protein
MPRSKSLLAVTTGVSKPTFRMSSRAWVLVEDQYGYKLAVDTRKQIENATLRHLWLDQMERDALPRTSATEILSAVQKSAQELLERLNALDLKPNFDPDSKPSASVRRVRDGDAQSFIGHLLRSRLRLPSGPRRRSFALVDHLGMFVRDLEALTLAMSDVHADVENFGYQQEGQAFRDWVRDLKGILKNAGLPCGTSRNIDTKKSLPFVRLVYGIQGTYPQWAWRYDNERALALAIYAAIHA